MSTARIKALKSKLALPVVAAPMFLVSGTELLLACCRAGVVGSLPAGNARSVEQLSSWLEHIEREATLARQTGDHRFAPWALNLVVQDVHSARFQATLELIQRFAPPIVITSFGAPGDVVERVQRYGGLVFHDVATLRHAHKAMDAGVDGLIVLTAGAGGHTGIANPFALVPAIRKIWDGGVLLAGTISDGRGIHAAEVLGADFAYMGTRFAATRESLAGEDYKSLLVSQRMSDVVVTDRLSGVVATFLKGAITRVGLDPDDLPPLRAPRTPNLPNGLKAWRDIWSAGQGVDLIDDVPPVSELVSRLRREYAETAMTVMGAPSTPAAR